MLRLNTGDLCGNLSEDRLPHVGKFLDCCKKRRIEHALMLLLCGDKDTQSLECLGTMRKAKGTCKCFAPILHKEEFVNLLLNQGRLDIIFMVCMESKLVCISKTMTVESDSQSLCSRRDVKDIGNRRF